MPIERADHFIDIVVMWIVCDNKLTSYRHVTHIMRVVTRQGLEKSMIIYAILLLTFSLFDDVLVRLRYLQTIGIHC